MPHEKPLARPPVALVVSEHEWSTLSLESVLGPNGYAVLRAYNGRQALDRLQTVSPDVVFIDSRLPDMEGAQLCRAMRQHANLSLSAPILVVTADHVTRQQQLGALRAGAWEYVRLPTDAEELLLRLESYMKGKFEADRAREESLLDGSTGLYSTRGLLKRARELASEASRHRRPLACIVVAPEVADEIKPPDQGTARELLHELVAVFRSGSRISDAIGRLGPREFVLLAPETDMDGARHLAERISQAIDEMNQSRTAESDAVNVRIGCYAVDDFREADIEPIELLTRATLALRRSQAETDRIFFYDRPAPTVN